MFNERSVGGSSPRQLYSLPKLAFVRPAGADCSPPVLKLVGAALELAARANDDEEAAASLADVAGDRRMSVLAANYLKFMRECEEDETSDRAWRLLVAASQGSKVPNPEPEQRVLFARVSMLKLQSRRQGFLTLRDLQPELEQLEIEIREKAKATKHREGLEPWRHFGGRLAELLGPEQDPIPQDKLLSTYAALNVGYAYLTEVYENETGM